MKIKTKPFGEIEVSEEKLITFPEGIYGFEPIKEYYLIEEKESPFLWLQSKEEPDLAFIVISPYEFKPDYEILVSDADLEVIDAKSTKDLLCFVIVTVPPDPSKMTANLQGPILINPKNRLAVQCISLKDEYTVKHSILEEYRKLLKK